MCVADNWHLLPSSLGICDPEDDLMMMEAYMSAKGDMAAYEEQVRMAELEAQKPKNV